MNTISDADLHDTLEDLTPHELHHVTTELSGLATWADTEATRRVLNHVIDACRALTRGRTDSNAGGHGVVCEGD